MSGEITSLAAAALPLDPTDVVEVVQNVGGTPVNKKVPVANLSGGSSRHWMRDDTSVSSGAVPVADTLVAGMTVTVPSAAQVRTAFVSFNVTFSGAHTNRFSIWLDGTKEWPPSGQVVANVAGGNSTYDVSASEVPISLTVDVAHTVEVRWNASDSTAAVTFYGRTLTVTV